MWRQAPPPTKGWGRPRLKFHPETKTGNSNVTGGRAKIILAGCKASERAERKDSYRDNFLPRALDRAAGTAAEEAEVRRCHLWGGEEGEPPSFVLFVCVLADFENIGKNMLLHRFCSFRHQHKKPA